MRRSVEIMTSTIADILRGAGPSIYLIGSASLGDFKPGWSDIDILCVTEKPISDCQAQRLVGLRQELSAAFPESPYFRLFEGGILPLKSLIESTPATVVYYGTSGQSIRASYDLDPFSRVVLRRSGILLYGPDVRERIGYPTRAELTEAVRRHYGTIRRHGSSSGGSLHTAGWLLDTARCLYTLRTGGVAAKTAAGEWAIQNGFVPDASVMERVLALRREPLKYRNDPEARGWLSSLGDEIQRFADVLEAELRKYGDTDEGKGL